MIVRVYTTDTVVEKEITQYIKNTQLGFLLLFTYKVKI